MGNITPNHLYHSAKVFITGANGFIGKHLCQKLLELGADITGTYWQHEPSDCNINWMKIDLCNAEDVLSVIQKEQPQFIFHLAAKVDGSRDLDLVQSTLDNNLLATVNILKAAQSLPSLQRLVLTNSQEEPNPENNEPVPCSPYAASKYAASAYGRMFHSLYAVPVVIARVFMVYGPEQSDGNKLVPYTILRALANEPPQIASGTRKIDWIYVEDVIAGLLKLGSSADIAGKTIDIGSGKFYSVLEIVQKILSFTAPALHPLVGDIADRQNEQQILAEVNQSSRLLDWQPKVSLDEGLIRTIKWYTDNRS